MESEEFKPLTEVELKYLKEACAAHLVFCKDKNWDGASQLEHDYFRCVPRLIAEIERLRKVITGR